MNSKDFIQALRKVIREEVQTAVRTEINNILNEQTTKPAATKKPLYTETYKPKKPAAVKKQFTANPTLNELLNETAGFTNEGPRAYMEESVNYNDFSEWPTMPTNRISKAPASMIPTVDAEGRRVDTSKLAQTEAGQAVVQALTKDYSALMKAIDKKKGK